MANLLWLFLNVIIWTGSRFAFVDPEVMLLSVREFDKYISFWKGLFILERIYLKAKLTPLANAIYWLAPTPVGGGYLSGRRITGLEAREHGFWRG